MFRRISNIRDFGVFNNFTGGTLPEFTPFNLIYGWNYSGKTTLSRMFRCLEVRALHADYPAARFGVLHHDGSSHDHEFKIPSNVRVFNEDFRKEHLLWDDSDGFSPILLLGAENIGRQTELNAKEEERKRLDANRTAAIQEAERLEDIIGKAETDCATQIVRELSVGRFHKTNLRPVIDSWNGVLPEPLDDAIFKAERAKITAEQKEMLPDLVVSTEPIKAIWEEAVAILSEQIGSTQTIARLVQHPDIGNWVEHGRHLHIGKTSCEFCEGQLAPDRVAALNAHFSDAFEDLKGRIASAIASPSSRKMLFSGSAYARSTFYVDLQAEHAAAGGELARERDDFNRSLEDLIDTLKRK